MAVTPSPAAAQRALYTADELRPLVRPRSIAIVGVSAKGTGFGATALKEVAAAGFSGPLFVVSDRIDASALPAGATAAKSISALPEPVDCVIVAVPAAAVEAIVDEAAAKGCRSALIFTSGFGETADGKEAEARLKAIAERTGIRIGGPNTAGILNYRDRLPLCFFSDLRMDLPSGNIAIVSQSGGLATHLGHRRHRGMGVSYTITTGNSVDVTALDYVNFLIEDEATRVIVLMLEGIGNAAGLALAGARARAAGKPLLVLKSGRTRQGERAAISHTGSLAGSHDVFLAAAAQAGLRVFQSTELLLETAQLFARWDERPYVEGGVAILTTMGGPGVMAADAAEDHGIALPPPSPGTAAELRSLMPAFAAGGNPVDTSAFQSDDMLRRSLETLAADDRYGAVVMLASTITGAATAKRPHAIAAAAENAAKPICAVWLSSWLEGPGSEILDAHPRLPVFRTVENAMHAIAHWQAWHRQARAAPDMTTDPDAGRAAADAAGTIDDATAAGALDEAASRRVLDALGIPSARAVLARNAGQAADAAGEIGFPVVAKIVSPDIPHKARFGGVKLGLATSAEARKAYDAIMAAVRAHAPDADLRGVLIAEMIPAGAEFMVGMVRDPVFGPVLVCGAGGGDVEELADVTRCVAPFTIEAARRAVRRTRLFAKVAAKEPARSEQVAEELARMMVRLGEFALLDDRIGEIDVNPVVQRDDGTLVALDALVVTRS